MIELPKYSEALTQLADAIHTGCMQRVNSIAEDAFYQTVKTHEEVMRERALMDSMSRNPTEWFAHNTGFGLGFAVAAMMLLQTTVTCGVCGRQD